MTIQKEVMARHNDYTHKPFTAVLEDKLTRNGNWKKKTQSSQVWWEHLSENTVGMQLKLNTGEKSIVWFKR